MNLEENSFPTYSCSQWFSTHLVFLLSQSNWNLSLLNPQKEGRFRCVKSFLFIMVILTAFKSDLCNIQSEKLAPEDYSSISSKNLFKKHEVCEGWISMPQEGKRTMRYFKVFQKAYFPGTFVELLLYKVYKPRCWKPEPTRYSTFRRISVSCLQSISVRSHWWH